jgi:hypothetical protein
MKDKELQLEETEASHTLGHVGEGRFQGRRKGIGCRCSEALSDTHIYLNLVEVPFAVGHPVSIVCLSFRQVLACCSGSFLLV